MPVVPSCLLEPAWAGSVPCLLSAAVVSPRRSSPGTRWAGTAAGCRAGWCLRVAEWAEAGLGEARHAAALRAYDQIIGLELGDVAVDGCLTKALLPLSRQMISRPRVLSHIFEPGTARALLHVMGALRVHHILFWEGEPVPDPEPFDGTVPLDVPGGLVPIPTPGHTSGHCSYNLPGRGVLISGDALVTEDFPRRTQPPEPQLMHPDFAHDYARALEPVQRLRDIAADVIIPGHGMPYHGSPASAVTHALARARAQPAQRR